MLRKFFILILSSFLLGGCTLGSRKSGLEIMSFPVAKVFVNDREVGMTPYKNMNLKPGENEIKLVNGNREWKRKVDLQNNVSTIIDWQFGDDVDGDSGYILYLERTGDKKASVLVNSNPDKSVVKIDNVPRGISPIKLRDIEIGERQLTVSLQGYKDINVFMKAIDGYQLVVDAKLAKEKIDIDQMINTNETSSSLNVAKKVTIKETETGWLRVREENKNSSKEIGRVKPGESYDLLEEKTDWYKIDIGSSKSGWISSTYAEKN